MTITVDKTDNGLASIIDDITKAKSLITLDTHDFADILQNNGDTIVIKAEESVCNKNCFDDLCKAVSEKIVETVANKVVTNIVLFIYNVPELPLMMEDMNHLNIIFDKIQSHDVSVKWGIGESDDQNLKLITILKIQDNSVCL